MALEPTIAELIAAVIVLGGTGFTLWALVDDAHDMLNVWRYGEINGPRWITAMGHFQSNLKFLIYWAAMVVWTAIAIYLPSRTDEPVATLSTIVGWLRVGSPFLILWAQLDQRIARVNLRRLPLAAWERMIASMAEGMAPSERTAMLRRLGLATGAGREMGHYVANQLTSPVAALSILLDEGTLTPEQAEIIETTLSELEVIAKRASTFHQEIKALDPEVSR